MPSSESPDPPLSSGVRIYVVDDDVEVRKSLHFLLATADIQAWPFASGEDFVLQLQFLEPAPVLLDIRMAGLDGFDVMAEMKAHNIDWPVIVMTAHGDVPVAVRAMKQGAIEFIEKPFASEELETALARAVAILKKDQALRTREATARHRFATLTPREAEVIGALAEGAPNKVVAHRLELSTRTIEMHRANGMAKLGVKSMAEAVALLALLNPPT